MFEFNTVFGLRDVNFWIRLGIAFGIAATSGLIILIFIVPRILKGP